MLTTKNLSDAIHALRDKKMEQIHFDVSQQKKDAAYAAVAVAVILLIALFSL